MKFLKNFFNLENIKNTDPIITVCIVLLIIIGNLIVFSTTYFINQGPSQFFWNQLVFYVIGLIVLIVFSIFNYQSLRNKWFFFLVLVVNTLLLVGVLLIGETVFGAKRWISLGNFNLQPSEFSKIAVIFFTAFLLKTNNKLKSKNKFLNFYFNHQSTVNTFLLFTLILFTLILISLQKSLGNTVLTALIFLTVLSYKIKFSTKFFIYVLCSIISFVIGYAVFNEIIPKVFLPTLLIVILPNILCIRKFKLNYLLFIILFLLSFLIFPILNYSYNNILQDYQRTRIESFINSDDDLTLSTKWNERQSLIAVGSGLLMGKGYLQGTQTNIGYLPFAHTDFAFASYSEQFGFIGNIILILIYTVLILRILKISNEVDDEFGAMISLGVAAMIFFNAAQHIGMNLNTLPITGVPLPFVSYGGSSLLATFIALGLVYAVNNFPLNKYVEVIYED